MASDLTDQNQSSIASKTSSQREELDLIRTTIASRTVRTSAGLTKFRPGELPTPEERQAAVMAIGRMRKSLSIPTSSDGTRKALIRLLSGLKPNEGADARATIEVMMAAVVGIPAAVLDIAVHELTTGTTDPTGPKYNRVFAPSSAELATLCRTIAERWKIRTDHLEMLLTLPEAVRVVEITDDERRANQARIAALRQRALTKEDTDNG